MSPPTEAEAALGAKVIAAVHERLAANKQVRRNLPERGRLHIDRQLPFLCVYRRPHRGQDRGTNRLVNGEASYLIASTRPRLHADTAALVHTLVETLSGEFGAFLLLELWAAPDAGRADDPSDPEERPTFRLHAPKQGGISRILEALERRLGRIRVLKHGVKVDVLHDDLSHPPGARPLLSTAEARRLGCVRLGLEVPPVYRSAGEQELFPVLVRAMRRSLGLALRKAFFEFSRSHTTHRPAHYHSLGRRAVVKAVWDVDRQLAEVSDSFDYLLQLTPVNSRDAFRRFKLRHFGQKPEFHYRPLPFDPGRLKRKLYGISVERVEDPALQHLFQQKQEELELKISMLRDRDTPRFLLQSQQLFGRVDDGLLGTATELLERIPRGSGRKQGAGRVDARGFAERVREDFAHYRGANPAFSGRVRVADDVSGLIVSRNTLMVPTELSVPAARVEALLAHEVGTHLLTYNNARAQPFRQLYSGLAAYEELQEGLAVLSEHLVGGLTRARLRQLAGRVVAAWHIADGASFVETFHSLHETHGFPHSAAWSITMRVYRGGGLTKDAVYLRGLCAVVEYLRQGGKLTPLYTGKLALEHVPIIKELLYRKVLAAPACEPRHLGQPECQQRLERVRTGSGSPLEFLRDVSGD